LTQRAETFSCVPRCSDEQEKEGKEERQMANDLNILENPIKFGSTFPKIGNFGNVLRNAMNGNDFGDTEHGQ
jgi:hypothetical protein